MNMTSASSNYFNQVAQQWDSLRGNYFTEAVREAAIRKAHLLPEMTVADVGAGTGFMTAGLAPLAQRVHVIDGSAAMLDVARKNLAAATNVEFHLSDGFRLPLLDGSVDAVFANMYLHHCPDPLAAIQEMARILKPGGRLVVTDLDTHTHTWMKEEMADEWLGFERSQVRAWFQEAGLVNTFVDCTGQSCCAESQTHDTTTPASEGQANISVFVAVGARRAEMRPAVLQTYSAIAENKASGANVYDALVNASQSSCCGGGSSEFILDLSKNAPVSGCCGAAPAQVTFATGYTAEDRAAVPGDASEISLGCGNPVALAGLKPGEVVLDIGSGGGIDAFLAAQRVAPAGRVIGVDMTPAMLERARATAERNGIANVEFRQGQAEALPVADASVDVILSNCVINLCEDKGQVFNEAWRVLKPGGRLEVSDMVTSGPLSAALRQQASEWSGCVSGALPEQEYLDLIRAAGFDQIQTRRSASTGQVNGVKVYSVIASALKA